MQAGGRLVEDVEGVAGALAAEFCGELHPLAFSSGEGHGRLPEPDISKADIHHGLELLGNGRDILEEFVCLADWHFQHIVDVLSLVFDGQGVLLVAAAAAGRADGVDRRQEVHFYDLDAGSLAFLAAAVLDIEGEAAGCEAPHFGVRGLFEEGADVVEHAGECGRVAPRSASDRALVDFYQLVDVGDALDAGVRERAQPGVVELVFEHRHQGLVDEGGFAAAAHAADAYEAAQRDVYVNVFQVVALGATDADGALASAAAFRHGDFVAAPQVVEGDRRPDDDVRVVCGVRGFWRGVAVRRGARVSVRVSGWGRVRALAEQQPRRSREADPAALLAGARAHIHQPVRTQHRLDIVLHHHHRIALVPQLLQRGNQLAVVPLVQPDARLIQNVEHIHQLRPDLRGEPDALAFPARKRRRGPVQRQIAQPHIEQEDDSVVELFEDVAGNQPLLLAEPFRQAVQPRQKVRKLHRSGLRYGFPVDFKTIRILVEARPAADRADNRLGNILHDAAVADHFRKPALADAEQLVGAEYQQGYNLIGEVLDRLENGKIVFARDGADDVEFLGLADLPQRHDCPVSDAHLPVGDNGVHIDVHNHPEALAVRAVALRRIERKGVRLGLRQRHPRVRTDQMLRIMVQLAGLHVHYGQ